MNSYRRLARDNSNAFTPYVAHISNNLAILLNETSRSEEAEAFYREALDGYRRLAQDNPDVFAPYAADICYNFGEFERDRGDMNAAKEYFEEALALYEKFPRLADDAQECRDILKEL